MSCSSRAMRARSSATATTARSRADALASWARTASRVARSWDTRSACPVRKASRTAAQWKISSLGSCSRGRNRSPVVTKAIPHSGATQRSRPCACRASE